MTNILLHRHNMGRLTYLITGTGIFIFKKNQYGGETAGQYRRYNGIRINIFMFYYLLSRIQVVEWLQLLKASPDG